jgi:hypothetical protein
MFNFWNISVPFINSFGHTGFDKDRFFKWSYLDSLTRIRGLPDGIYLHAKNTNLGIFWRNSELKMLVYFISIWNIYCHLVFCRAIWYILWPFGIFYGRLEILQTFGIFSPFWCAVQKKSGNPGFSSSRWTSRVPSFFQSTNTNLSFKTWRAKYVKSFWACYTWL